MQTGTHDNDATPAGISSRAAGVVTAAARGGVALALLALAACARVDAPALRDIVPASAERLEERGSWDVAISEIGIALVADLRRLPHDDIDSRRWKMPASVGFEQACAGLQRVLGAGWRPLDPAQLPPRGVDARRCGWREPATFGHDRLFVLAWDEVPVRLATAADPVRLAATVFTRGD